MRHHPRRGRVLAAGCRSVLADYFLHLQQMRRGVSIQLRPRFSGPTVHGDERSPPLVALEKALSDEDASQVGSQFGESA